MGKAEKKPEKKVFEAMMKTAIEMIVLIAAKEPLPSLSARESIMDIPQSTVREAISYVDWIRKSQTCIQCPFDHPMAQFWKPADGTFLRQIATTPMKIRGKETVNPLWIA
jgi:hypothetical protein